MSVPGGPAPYFFGEVASLAVIAGAFTQILPTIATCLAIVWYVLMLIEARIERQERRARSRIDKAAEDALERTVKATETVVEKATEDAAQKVLDTVQEKLSDKH